MSALKRSHDGAPSPRLDEDLNSRNLFTFGIDAMKKMAGAAVAVVGMNGVGAEAAKSLILANIGRVTLVDDAEVGMKDLSAHFYLSESDAGLNRARACHQRLQELNPNVEVRVHTERVTEAFLAEHDAVVVCDGRVSQHVEWNSWCRTIRNDNGVSVAFVLAEARGACFRLFSDFGDQFESVPGDKVYCLPVLNLTSSAASGRVTVTVSVEGTDTPPQEGDAVMFSGVDASSDCEGQPDIFRVLNHPAAAAGAEPSVRQFDVHARGLRVGQYAGRGHVTRVVQPVTSTFHSLEHSLQSPGNLSDRAWKAFSFDNRSELLHVAFAALNQIMQQRSVPASTARDALNVDLFVETCKTIHSSNPCNASFALDDNLLRAFAATCGGVLNPIAAIAGSLAAQEAIKRCSQKYIPISNPQWFYYDALDVVPDISSHVAAEFEPQHCRYDSQIAVLGRSFQQLLGSSNVFVIGAGAIGCELLKNFAMMGVACSGGVLTVTDNDHIEKSNLSRQFLFRHHHIKQSKSKCAKESVQVINPQFNVVSHDLILDHSSQHVFSDNFWRGIHVAVNALDTTKARKFVSDKCMRFSKPNLECSTEGLYCSAAAFLPHITRGYEYFTHDPNSALPCTIKSFPYLAIHCLQYAQGEFAFEFSIVPQPKNISCVVNMKDAPREQDNHLLILERIALSCLNVTSFSECVAWARELYDEYLWRIDDTVLEHPQDEIDDSGAKFWTAPKRFPSTKEFAFNWADEDCRRFVISAAVLKAKSCGVALHNISDIEIDSSWLQPRDHPLFSQRSTRDKIMTMRASPQQALEPSCVDAAAAAEADEIRRLVTIASSSPHDHSRISPLYFNKDDSTHMYALPISSAAFLVGARGNAVQPTFFCRDFALACSCIRMKCFGIAPMDKIEAVRVLGNSMPAVATATAVAAGLACIHFLRLFRHRDELSQAQTLAFHEQEAMRSLFHQASVSLETLQPAVFDAMPAAEYRVGRARWTAWDVWRMQGMPRVRGLWDFLKSQGVDLCALADVRFESLNLLDGQFNVPPGALLSHSCRKKLKEGMDGAASEKQALWCKVMEGRNDMAIDIAVYSAKIVMLGPAAPSMRCDIQVEVDKAASSMSVASIKSHLCQKHGINWNDPATGYTLCRLHDEHASGRLEDDGQEVEVGALMMVYPANPKQLLQLPRVVFDLPAEAIEIDGVQAIPVNVKASDSDREQFVELVLPLNCTVLQLKQRLQAAGVGWAVDSSKVMSFSNKLMKNEAVIPCVCDLPIKVVQQAM